LYFSSLKIFINNKEKEGTKPMRAQYSIPLVPVACVSSTSGYNDPSKWPAALIAGVIVGQYVMSVDNRKTMKVVKIVQTVSNGNNGLIIHLE
jgi:hypothetical protein